jgi:flagellar biosynthesis protein FliP
MAKTSWVAAAAALGGLLCLCVGGDAMAAAADLTLPGVDIRLGSKAGETEQVSSAIKIMLGLTVLSLAPAILVSMTAFIRISIVLSMLRHAFGMQETPPNTVLVSLALFLTLFTMAPVLEQVNKHAFQPYMDGRIGTTAAAEKGVAPLRDFMIRQTREQDLALMIELAKKPEPKSVEEVSMVELIPAFMISELRAAFQIGFVVFLPFLLIDLVVSTILMSLGMMMVPPVTIALPVKILMFVLIDGWNLVLKALLGTFH